MAATWTKHRASNGRTYYKRKQGGRTQIKWGKNAKIITLAAPFKKGKKSTGKKRKASAKRKTAKKGKKRKLSKSAKRCSPARPACKIPKGKRKGDTFTKGGKKYRVVSYTTRGGKRVRYAAKV